ncbi:MAG TPA: transposase [Candidatus Tectomicrobia bacterium]|nr:transposase [Candidatus Tectomicrobia bacterium]
MVRKTFRYRLYPTRRQGEALAAQLDEARTLYNAALQERRDAYRQGKISLNYYDQANQLKAIRADGSLGLANFSACQDVLRRVQKTFDAFFRRVKAGEKAGYPRFKGRTRFDSYTFPSYGDGCRVRDNGRLYCQGLGELKVKWHRPLHGTIKTVTLKREAGRWYVCFSVEVEPSPLPGSTEAVGIDVGLEAFTTLSDGTRIENPHYFKTVQAQLRRAQRRVARRKKGSHRRRKAVQALQRVHAHVRNQRRDFHHQVARQLVNRYGVIAVEDLNIKGLARGMLAKAVHDVGWGIFLMMLLGKAVEAGRRGIKVYAPGTSQECPCGAPVPKRLGDRWHHCDACGLSVPRDHASALCIKLRGLRSQASSEPLGLLA